MTNRIRALRLEKGLNQTELGKLLKVSQRSVSFYESGERDPDTETLKQLSGVFECSIDYLLGNAEKRTYEGSDRDERILSVEGLAEEEIRLVQDMIDLLKKKREK